MEIDLSRKRIIMIHGLASKPPQSDLHEMWSSCLIENIRVDDAPLGDALERHRETVFRSAYWANATPHHLEDDEDYVTKLRVQVQNVIKARQDIKDDFHVGREEKLGAFFKDRGLDVARILVGALTVKDDVLKAYLREVDLYSSDQYIADRMRAPLENELRSAWESDCDVALLAHSMGTFIGYDVLWRFSHRNDPGFTEYRNRRVQIFTTMGSPLGDTAVRDLLFARFHEQEGIRQFPTNIDFWHNCSCLGDAVAYQNNFNSLFFEPMRSLGILPQHPVHRAIDYASLHNPFEVVEHEGNIGRERRNPHKSYGYLVQPRLGTWIADFLHGRLI